VCTFRSRNLSTAKDHRERCPVDSLRDSRIPCGRVAATYILPESIYQVRGNRYAAQSLQLRELSRGHRYAVAPFRGGPI